MNNKSLYRYKLEKRISKLEKLIIEDEAQPPSQLRVPRHREVKQNLFSRKFDEVKSAVDAGQDVNQINDKGQTPLMFACGDTKGASCEIISYLLDHGANANDICCNRPVLSACCKFGDGIGAKALIANGANIHVRWKGMLPVDTAMTEGNIFDDTLVDLIDSKVILNDHPLISELSKAVSSGKLNEDIYSRIIRKALDCNSDYVSSGDVVSELKRGLQVLFDYYTETLKMVPPLDSYDIVNYLDRNQLLLYYNAYVRASNGELKIRDMYNYLYTASLLCKTLNYSNDFIYNFVTPEYVVELQKDNYGKIQLNQLISSAISNDKSKVLQTISKARPKTCSYGDIILSCVNRNSSESGKVSLETTKAACRILNSCLPNKAMLSSGTTYALRSSTNKYLLAYMIERGYGESIVSGLRSLDGSALSPECRDAIVEGGVEFKPFDEFNDDDRKKHEEDYKRLYFLRHIINGIAKDEWNRNNERYVTEHPDILLDDSIQDAIEQNPDSFTARQLKRRIDQLPNDICVYDM